MPLTYKLAKQILNDLQIPKINQVGSHEQYWLWKYKITLPNHKELTKNTAKSFIDQISIVKNISIKNIINSYNIKL